MIVRPALFAALFLLFALPAVSPAADTTVEDWSREFADVCGHTQQAMNLADDALTDYLRRCERLQERIGELGGNEDPARRFYAKRLQMCMDFYRYIIDFRKQEK